MYQVLYSIPSYTTKKGDPSTETWGKRSNHIPCKLKQTHTSCEGLIEYTGSLGDSAGLAAGS